MNIEDYYNNYDEDGRLISKHGMVEYTTTMKYIEKYLKDDSKIIEIGAGTGRYSHALARQGYTVDAVELVQHNIDIFKENTLENEKVTITQGNATDLSNFEDNKYDITLLLGPMYHLFTEEEQTKALNEAYRVTKDGGIIFIAYCMADASTLSYGFVKNQIHTIIKDCHLDENFSSFKEPWGIFKLYRIEDIEKLRNKLNVSHLHLVGVDGYANHIREVIDNMDDDTFNLFLKYHLSICERTELLGLSHHTLDICKKNNIE